MNHNNIRAPMIYKVYIPYLRGKLGSLVDAKADVQQAHDGRAPLSRASTRGDLMMVRQLVLGRADLDAVAVAQGTTPLLEAVESGHVRTVQFLIESRADLEKPGHNDTAPLLRACELRKYALVSLLLEQRADVNKKRGVDGETATSRALACGYSEIVRALAEVQAHAKGACWEGQLKMLCFAQRSRWWD